MSIKNQILLDIKQIENPNILQEIFEFMQQLKDVSIKIESNKEAVLQFAGVLKDKDAQEINGIIDAEFNSIEGDW